MRRDLRRSPWTLGAAVAATAAFGIASVATLAGSQPVNASETEVHARGELVELLVATDQLTVTVHQFDADPDHLGTLPSTVDDAVIAVRSCLQEMAESGWAWPDEAGLRDLLDRLEAATSAAASAGDVTGTLTDIAGELAATADAILAAIPDVTTDTAGRQTRAAAIAVLTTLTTPTADADLDAATEALAQSLRSLTSVTAARSASDHAGDEHDVGEDGHAGQDEMAAGETQDPTGLAAVASALAVADEAVGTLPEPAAPDRSAGVALAAVAFVSASLAGALGVDVVRRRRGEDRLIRHRAMVDDLTGLLSRGQLDATAAAVRASSPEGISILYVDLDDFKNVNDSFGHHVGDAVLASVGRQVQTWLGPDDRALRLGGDEFLVLLAHTPSPDLTGSRATQLIDLLSPPVTVDGKDVRVGVSVGARWVGSGDAIDDAVRFADAALYAAKRAGRGRSVLSTVGMEAQPSAPGTSTTAATRASTAAIR